MITKNLTYREAIEPVLVNLESRYDTNNTTSLLFLAEFFKTPNFQFLNNLDKLITNVDYKHLKKLENQLNRNIPLPYILGNISFYKDDFMVNDSVLIPRSDSEVLVETILDNISLLNYSNTIDCLEIGFGSGCLSISVAKYSKKEIKVVAYDISEYAKQIAETNSSLNLKNGNTVKFFVTDILKTNLTKSYDIIFSNPPYIPKDEYEQLDSSLHYEPRIALTDEGDGLIFYKRLKELCENNLKPTGSAFFEIHSTMEKEVMRIFRPLNSRKLEIIKDLTGKPRVICIKPS